MSDIEYCDILAKINDTIYSIDKCIKSDVNNEYDIKFKENCFLLKYGLKKFILKYYTKE